MKVNFTTKVTLTKKIFMVIGAIFVCGIIFLFFLQQTIKLKGYKNKINASISSVLSSGNSVATTRVAIAGRVRYKSFPIPHVLVTNIRITDLLEANYLLNGNIRQIMIPVSILDIMKRKITINKIRIVDANIIAKEVDKVEENSVSGAKALLRNCFDKNIISASNVVFAVQNSFLAINGTHTREFGKINLNGSYGRNSNTMRAIGDLKSNGQPVEIEFLSNTNDIDLILSSDAFKLKVTLDFTPLGMSGKVELDAVNLQLFTMAMFNTNTFWYNKVIDNGMLKGSLDISFSNNILSITNIQLHGQSINAVGQIELNLNSNQKGLIDFDVKEVNFDKLIEKGLVGKKRFDEKHVMIFGNEVQDDRTTSENFLTKMFQTNPVRVNINIGKAKFKDEDIRDSVLELVHFKDGTNSFQKISSKLPGNTTLDVQNDTVTMVGENFAVLQKFLTDASNVVVLNTKKNKSKKTDTNVNDVNTKDNFEFNGTLRDKPQKIIVEDFVFKHGERETNGDMEVHFDGGISFVALRLNMDEFKIDESIFETDTTLDRMTNTLKNRLLFLNAFNLNTFVKFNIKDLEYGGKHFLNQRFTINTAQGFLRIYDVNLNNKVFGDVSFDTTKTDPQVHIDLSFKNYVIQDNIPLYKFILNLPSFEDTQGKINLSAESIKFKQSDISTLNLSSTIDGGVVNIDKFEFNGFGGTCDITGFLSMQYNRKLNLLFNSCTVNIGQTLYLFSGTKNIDGIVGFNATLYNEGINLRNFTDSTLLKLRFVGSGIEVRRYGISELLNELFKMTINYKLARDVNTADILKDTSKKTIFENISGLIQLSGQRGQFDIDVSRELINGKFTGNIELLQDAINIDSNANFVMLLVLENTNFPISIATKIFGNTVNNLQITHNLQQADEYVNSLKRF